MALSLKHFQFNTGEAAGTTLQLLDRVQRRAIQIIRSPKLTKDLDSLGMWQSYASACSTDACMTEVPLNYLRGGRL